MDNLGGRIKSFIGSMSNYPPREHPAGQVADVFNALLEATKEEHPDDPVIGAIEPAGKLAQSRKSSIDAGSLLAVAHQLLAGSAGRQ